MICWKWATRIKLWSMLYVDSSRINKWMFYLIFECYWYLHIFLCTFGLVTRYNQSNAPLDNQMNGLYTKQIIGIWCLRFSTHNLFIVFMAPVAFKRLHENNGRIGPKTVFCLSRNHWPLMSEAPWTNSEDFLINLTFNVSCFWWKTDCGRIYLFSFCNLEKYFISVCSKIVVEFSTYKLKIHIVTLKSVISMLCSITRFHLNLRNIFCRTIPTNLRHFVLFIWIFGAGYPVVDV